MTAPVSDLAEQEQRTVHNDKTAKARSFIYCIPPNNYTDIILHFSNIIYQRLLRFCELFRNVSSQIHADHFFAGRNGRHKYGLLFICETVIYNAEKYQTENLCARIYLCIKCLDIDRLSG